MLRACLHKNSFRPKMSIKLILAVWSNHIVIMKLLRCNSIAVFLVCFFLSNHEIFKLLRWWLLNSWITINFWTLWKTNIVLFVLKTTCLKSWRTSLQNFCKVGVLESRACYVIFSKRQFFSWAGYYNRKHDIFPFTDVSSFIFLKKKSLGKETFD